MTLKEKLEEPKDIEREIFKIVNEIAEMCMQIIQQTQRDIKK